MSSSNFRKTAILAQLSAQNEAESGEVLRTSTENVDINNNCDNYTEGTETLNSNNINDLNTVFDINNNMRRASFTPVFNLSTQEPLIVVEETNAADDGDETEGAAGGGEGGATKRSNSDDSEPDSPVNPYLLCPFPDMHQRRKHSLPSLQITEGITASQVRRLSEVGGESGGLSPKEVEFLATLSQKANPAAGGRRHSVVTISAVPPTLFGRNRRESISGMTFSGSRRGSGFQGPPLTDHRGSVHNLQLDIMDGIVQTRKTTRSGSGVWTAPVLQENDNNVSVQT